MPAFIRRLVRLVPKVIAHVEQLNAEQDHLVARVRQLIIERDQLIAERDQLAADLDFDPDYFVRTLSGHLGLTPELRHHNSTSDLENNSPRSSAITFGDGGKSK